MKTLAIIGSGDLGKQISHYATSDNHFDEVIFFDDYDANAYGKIENVESSYKNKDFDALIFAIGYKHLAFKKSLAEKFKDIPFATIIHSSAWIDPTAKIGSGSIIYPACTLDANVEIGNHCVVNLASSIAHDSKISNFCFLSPRVAIAGFVTIAEQCIIGINATIIDNLSITENTQLGGGSVVIKNIEKPGLYVGNPVRFIR